MADIELLNAATIGAEEAVRRAQAGDIQLVDGTWTLPGSEDPLRAVLPGTTAQLDTAAIKAVPVAERTPERLAEWFRGAGLTTKLPLAIYDRKGLFSVTWIWWMLHECGYTSQVVQGYAEGAGEVGKDNAPGFELRAPHCKCATLDDVLAAQANGIQIVDARPAERFRGESPEPRAGVRAGHIPGSLNLPFGKLKHGDRFLAPAELFDLAVATGIDTTRPVITTCGSGVTASGLAFCLNRAGIPAQVYMGSWAEYGASDHPVETGP